MNNLRRLAITAFFTVICFVSAHAASIDFTSSSRIAGSGIMLYFDGYGTTFAKDKSLYSVSFVENTSSASSVNVQDASAAYLYLVLNAGPVNGNKIVLEVLYDDGATQGCGKIEFSGTQFVKSIPCDSKAPTWMADPSFSCGSPTKVGINVATTDDASNIAGYKVTFGSCVDKDIPVTAGSSHVGAIELPLASCGVSLTSSSNETAILKPYDSAGNVGEAKTVTGIKVLASTLTMQSVACGESRGRSITLIPNVTGGNAASYNVSVNGATPVSYPSGASIEVTGLNTETTYSFAVSAVDACGNASATKSTSCTTIFEPYGGADYPEELTETPFDITYTGTCSTSIAGGTAFSQSTASGAYSHTIDEIDMVGALKLSDSFEEAYSNGYFHQDQTKSQYAIVSNPKVLNGTYTQKKDGKNRLIMAIGKDPAGEQKNLFSFKRENVGAGTTTISFVLEDLVGNATCPQNNLNSFRGLTIVYYKNGAVVAEQHVNHPIGTSQTYSYNFATAQGDDVMVDVRARYMAPCTALSISDLNVYGCLPKAITTSNGASIFCEQSDVTLLATGVSQSTLQWQTSTDNATWTTISGQTGMTATVSVPLGNSYYRFRESASSAWSQTYTLLGQVCCTYLESQKPIWIEDFGTVTGRTENAYVKNHTFKASGKIDDCYYAVVSNSSQANQELDWPGGKTDHTGNANGGFLVINVNNTIAPPVLIYEQEINPVQGFCESTYYNLSMFASNIAPGGLPSSFKFQVVDAVTSAILGEGETGDISDFGMANWLNYGVSFKPAGNPVKIQIYNTGYAGGGNDVVIDDIAVSVCNASIELLSNGKATIEEPACGTDVPLEVKINGKSETFFGTSDPYYLWLKKTNAGAFQVITEASGHGKGTYQAPTQANTNYEYKVLMAADEATALRAFSGNKGSCDIYTESNIMEVSCIPCTQPTLSLQASNTLLCSSSTEQPVLTVTVTNATPSRYVWAVKEQGASTYTPLVTHNVTNTTDTYTITSLPATSSTYQVTVYTADGCSNSATIDIDIVQTEIPTITATATQLTCVQTSSQLTASLTNWSSVTSQQWNKDGVAMAGKTARTLTVSEAGIYTFTATYGNGCSETSTPIEITKDDTQPTVSVSVDGNDTELTCNLTSITLRAASTTSNVTYKWTVDNNATVLSTNDNHTTSNKGIYTVTVTAQNGCTGTDQVTITENVAQPTVQLTANRDVINCKDLDATLTVTATGGDTPYQYAWNGGAYGNETTQTVTAGGTYTVKVKGGNGCESNVESKTITENITTPTVTLASDVTPAVLTCATTQITLSATASNGATPYQYDWGTGYANQNTQTVSEAGSYTVSVIDANFCVGTSTSLVVTQDTLTSPVTLSANATQFTCSVVSIQLDAAVDAAFASKVDKVEWYKDNQPISGQSALTYTATEEGNYSAVVYFANGCSRGSAVVALTKETNLPTVQIAAKDAATTLTCTLQSIGLSAVITGGVAPYTYQWNTVPATTVLSQVETYSADAAGKYQVSIQDANGCEANADYTITSDTEVPVISLLPNNPTLTCSVSSVDLSFTDAGTTPSVNYLWTLPDATQQTTSTLSATVAGDYKLTTQAANGCWSVEQTVTVVSNTTASTVSLSPASYEYCSDAVVATLPTFTATVSGGSVKSYRWEAKSASDTDFQQLEEVNSTASTAAYTLTALPTETTEYRVVVTNNDDCQSSAMATVTIYPNNLQVTLASTYTELTCDNVSTDITSTVTGTTNTVSYVWSDASTAANLSGITVAGTYEVTVTDDVTGCTANANIQITEDTAQPTAQLTANRTLINCQDTDATLTVTATGGSGTYQYAWNGAAYGNETTQTVTTGGTYTVKVKGANGCESTEVQETITENKTTPTVTISSDVNPATLTCAVTSMNLTATPADGAAPYRYDWGQGYSDNATLPVTTDGSYAVTIIDDNFCTGTSAAFVVSTDTLTTEVILTPDATLFTCSVTSINLAASVDAAFASKVDKVEWYKDGQLLSGQNSLTYAATAAGDYQAVVYYTNGCHRGSAVQSLVQDANMPSVTLSATATTLTCAQTTTTITATATAPAGIANYTWSTGLTGASETALTLTLGVDDLTNPFKVTVVDNNGCESSADITISEDTEKPLIAVTPNAPQFTCATGSITLQAMPQDPAQTYSYQWTNGPASDTYVITQSGTYTVVATGSNGCESDPVNVTATDAVNNLTVSMVSNVVDNELTCYATNIVLTATAANPVGEVKYEWVADVAFDASSTHEQTVVAPGTYQVKVSDDNGCFATETITITQNIATPTVNIIASAPKLTCTVTNIDLTASAIEDDGTFYYEWDPTATTSQPVKNVTETGDYTVRVIGSNGCESTQTYTVQADNSIPVVTIVPDNNVTEITCDVTSITLTAQATGGVVAADYQYKWIDNAATTATRSVTSYGDYSVEVTDDNGCVGTGTINITENIAKPVVYFDANMPTELTCKQMEIQVIPIAEPANLAPFDYYWGDGDRSSTRTIASPVENLSLYVESTVNGCESELSVLTITQAENNLAVSIEATADVLTCNRESITISATATDAVLPIVEYKWVGGYEDQSIVVTQAGQYWVEVEDNNGCTAKSNTVYIKEWYTSPDATIEQVGPDSMLITPIGTEAMPWIYQLDNDTTYINGLAFSSYAGTHELIITDQNGCQSVLPFVIELRLPEIRIPLFFTPNDDGLNDTWEIDSIEYFPDALIQIYDRYHKLLIEYKGADPGWDGMYNGHPMPSDDYWYYIRDIHIGRPKSGHFRLHRGKTYNK